MSGFEIAGVVLGLFPIVCDAAKDLRGVAKDAQSWWQFQTSFDDFIARLYTERVYFDQAIVALLDPLQELSNRDLEALRYNTNPSLWHDLRIQAMLANRIDPSHLSWFMRQLKDIIDALKELKEERRTTQLPQYVITTPHESILSSNTDERHVKAGQISQKASRTGGLSFVWHLHGRVGYETPSKWGEESASKTRGGLERAPEKLKKRQQQEDSTKNSWSPKVQFSLPPEPVATPTTPTAVNRMDQAISDMCLTIETPSQEPCLGFLKLSDAKLFLHLDTVNYPERLEMQTFEEFLSERHPRDFRLNLGLTVIMLILKLGPSWIPEKPLKSSLVILQTPGCPPQPFISHPSIHAALESTHTIEFQKEKEKGTFLALGIILLELLFRKSLEEQSFWATFTDNGKRHEFTDFAAASRWQKDAVYEYGEKVANAIGKCVNYTVDNAVNLRSAEFLQEVWEKVLRPIEETLACSSSVS
ncbi:unnamed protein product [Fusarium graminearum]|nr:unnamed protein product [Fusarium graminearum]CAG1982154.1 unnamed protein product [Fusarium graminearum]